MEYSLLTLALLLIGSGAILPFFIESDLTITQAIKGYGGWYGALVGFLALITVSIAQFSHFHSEREKETTQKLLSIALSIKWELQKNLLYLGYAKSTLESRESVLPNIEPPGEYNTNQPSHFTVGYLQSVFPPFDMDIARNASGSFPLLRDNILRDVYIFYAGLSSIQHILQRLESELGKDGKVPNNLFGGLKLSIFGCQQAGRYATKEIDKILLEHKRKPFDFVKGLASE